MKTPSLNRPGLLSRFVCLLLSFLLMLVSFAAVLIPQLQRIVTDRTLYLSADVQAEEWTWLKEKLLSIGDEQHFSPDVLDGILTPDVLVSQREALTDWLLSTLSGDVQPVPSWFDQSVIDAICADEAFQAAVIPAMRQIVARDQAAAAVSSAINQAVLPLRTSLIQLGISLVAKQINPAAVFALLPTLLNAVPVICAALIILMLLVMFRSWVHALPYIAAGFSAGGWLTLLFVAALWLMNIPSLIASVSALCAVLVSSIGMALLPALLVFSAGLLFIGQLLLCLYRRLAR